MKPQSIHGAMPTEHLLLTMDETMVDQECKLDLGRCVTFLFQFTCSLGACILVHWVVT